MGWFDIFRKKSKKEALPSKSLSRQNPPRGTSAVQRSSGYSRSDYNDDSGVLTGLALSQVFQSDTTSDSRKDWNTTTSCNVDNSPSDYSSSSDSGGSSDSGCGGD